MKKPIEPVYLLLGAKVRSLREALGWTQDDLAKRIGHTKANLSFFETGQQRIALHDVEKIALAFGTTPKHLMKGIWT